MYTCATKNEITKMTHYSLLVTVKIYLTLLIFSSFYDEKCLLILKIYQNQFFFFFCWKKYSK